MKRILVIGIFVIFCLQISSQEVKTQEEFERLSEQYETEFKQNIDKYNQEFIKILKENWSEYNVEKPIIKPLKIKPIKPLYFKMQQSKVPFRVFSSHIVISNPIELEKKRAFIQGEILGEAKGAKRHEIKKRKIKQTLIRKKEKPDVVPSNLIDKTEDTETKTIVTEKQPQREDNRKRTLPNSHVVRENITLAKKGISFSFYGINLVMSKALKNCFKLNHISPNAIGEAWEACCKTNYKTVIKDCQRIYHTLNLNDWGMVLLTNKIAKNCVQAKNDQRLLQMFLLVQCGYKVRLARSNKDLILLAPIDCMLYARPYLKVNGVRYFQITSIQGTSSSIYTYKKDYTRTQREISMYSKQTPQFQGKIKTTIHSSKLYPQLTVSARVSEQLIAYYKDFPQCDFSVYYSAPVSKLVQESVLPSLREIIQGKTLLEASNLILNFVQTGFKYQTDDKQFNYEKPFFPDELFYYPYCDCEDRSILFAYLVRTLLQLDVVLLDYPGHIAAAVHFKNQSLKGDYLTIQGKRYYVCDPTYINARIGTAMPNMSSKNIKVLQF